jgi:hypothetical protein
MHFGLVPKNPTKRQARYQAPIAAKEAAQRIADGQCVHHKLLQIGVKPRFTKIPSKFASPAPPVQINIFAEQTRATLSAEPFAIMHVDEIAPAMEASDHILGESIQRRISAYVSEEADRRMRLVWIVPSCAFCNQRRSGNIEDIGYLVHVFGFFLQGHDFAPHHAAAEAALFIDAVKSAHMHLQYERQFTEAASRRA